MFNYYLKKVQNQVSFILKGKGEVSILLKRKYWLIISLLLILFGTAGGINILINGEHAMGTNNEVPWGALIAGYIFFVGASAGISLVSSLGHVFKIERFEVLGKRALLAGISTLLMGFAVLAFELGKPLNLIYILFSPGFSSAIFWMGALYGLLLILLLIEFYFAIKGNHKWASLIGLFVVIIDIAAHSNLGAVFGSTVASPYWNGPFISVYLIVLAILLGIAVLAVMFYIIDRTNINRDKLVYKNEHIVSTLGKLMAVFIGVTFLFSFWNIYTNLYGEAPGQYGAAMSLINGPLSIQFWLMEVMLMMVIPFTILTTKGGFKPKRVFIAGILTIIGNLFARINLVFAGQIVSNTYLPGEEWSYNTAFVSWSEWAVLIGAIGGSILLYLIGEKLFKLDVEQFDNSYHKGATDRIVEA